jgi:hypothetical protein
MQSALGRGLETFGCCKPMYSYYGENDVVRDNTGNYLLFYSSSPTILTRVLSRSGILITFCDFWVILGSRRTFSCSALLSTPQSCRSRNSCNVYLVLYAVQNPRCKLASFVWKFYSLSLCGHVLSIYVTMRAIGRTPSSNSFDGLCPVDDASMCIGLFSSFESI